MFTKRFTLVMLIVALFSLEGCVAPPPRQRVIYHEGSESADAPAGRYCHTCGTVRDIDQVELRQGNTGGGAVLGAPYPQGPLALLLHRRRARDEAVRPDRGHRFAHRQNRVHGQE